MLGKARTGSGKTLGFGLPAIVRLAETGRPEANKPRAIVLVPTRELAMQVNDALEPYAHSMHVSLRLIAGGLSMSKQVYALERGVHMVVATPGRLADLVRRGDADLSDVSLVVLDEADHMADMGFMEEITEILARVPKGGQRLLFSATLDGDVDKLVRDYMSDPILHDVTDGDDASSSMTHVGLNVPPHLKYQIANRIVSREGRTIVFVRTKLGCDRIAGQMREAGVNAIALHGDKSQAERNTAISGFRAGTVPVLVATDVAARGIHVDAVDLVMQIDPPADHKDYTHRAGRTARAGHAGMVVTLVLPHQRKTVDRLFENAGIEPLFRKIRGDDSESMAMVDMLTGGHEPSGIPVPEPRVPRSASGRGRPERGGGSRGRNDGPRRPSKNMSDGGRWDSRREDSGASRARDDLARKERDLAERERRLSMREQELTARSSAPQSAPTQSQPARNSDDRKPYQRDERKSYDRKPYQRDERSRPETGRDDRKSYDRKPYQRDDRSSGSTSRDARPAKSSWSKDSKPTGSRDDRKSYDRKPYQRDDRSSGSSSRDDRPAKSSWSKDSKPTGSRDDRKSYDRKPYQRDERSRPETGRDDRQSYDRKPYQRDDRPSSSYSRDDRPAKSSWSKDSKPTGGRDDRKSYDRKPYQRDDRSGKPAGRDERSSGGPKRSYDSKSSGPDRSGDKPSSGKPKYGSYNDTPGKGKKSPKKSNRSGKPRPKKK
ncbi:DEAD/DEAH box helicase [Demequina aurantiaca]|uniref:DEAD/DEAH box helicase n=1 Tax=Demequina aurantiaca TaxID=676200 RepID=UPI003D34C3AA